MEVAALEDHLLHKLRCLMARELHQFYPNTYVKLHLPLLRVCKQYFFL
jgi:hypothetical protein